MDQPQDDLRDRTYDFALRIVKLVKALPNTVEARALGGQVVRSGTSVGANYRAARRGRSRKEFLARLGVVVEEADETVYWLQLLCDGEILPRMKVADILDEARQLVAIMSKAASTTRRNM